MILSVKTKYSDCVWVSSLSQEGWWSGQKQIKERERGNTVAITYEDDGDGTSSCTKDRSRTITFRRFFRVCSYCRDSGLVVSSHPLSLSPFALPPHFVYVITIFPSVHLMWCISHSIHSRWLFRFPFLWRHHHAFSSRCLFAWRDQRKECLVENEIDKQSEFESSGWSWRLSTVSPCTFILTPITDVMLLQILSLRVRLLYP